ncbi:MAG: efflux RND transporter periplasmic adaptor subunit, partial [Anaerolineae bacterium]
KSIYSYTGLMSLIKASSRERIRGAGLLMVTLCATLMSGCWGEGRADPGSGDYLHLAVTAPLSLQQGYRRQREFAGEVQAHQSSLLGFELPGQVAEILVNEGDAVLAGQLLARLDTRLLESARNELQARRIELVTELQLAERNLGRISTLRNDNLASEREQDELDSRVTMLRAGLQRVEAELEANTIRLQQSELRAPFAARIASRELDSGVVVAAGTAVLRLVETARREVRAGLPVAIADGLARGGELRLRKGSEWATGPVLALGPTVDQATRSRAVRIGVDRDWSPGSLAYVVIEEPVEEPGAWVPATAVTEGLRGTWTVYVAMPEGDARYRIESRSVVIHHADAERLYVSGAVRDGELVVQAGLHRYAPGQLVRVETAPRIVDARPES